MNYPLKFNRTGNDKPLITNNLEVSDGNFVVSEFLTDTLVVMVHDYVAGSAETPLITYRYDNGLLTQLDKVNLSPDLAENLTIKRLNDTTFVTCFELFGDTYIRAGNVSANGSILFGGEAIVVSTGSYNAIVPITENRFYIVADEVDDAQSLNFTLYSIDALEFTLISQVQTNVASDGKIIAEYINNKVRFICQIGTSIKTGVFDGATTTITTTILETGVNNWDAIFLNEQIVYFTDRAAADNAGLVDVRGSVTVKKYSFAWDADSNSDISLVKINSNMVGVFTTRGTDLFIERWKFTPSNARMIDVLDTTTNLLRTDPKLINNRLFTFGFDGTNIDAVEVTPTSLEEDIVKPYVDVYDRCTGVIFKPEEYYQIWLDVGDVNYDTDLKVKILKNGVSITWGGGAAITSLTPSEYENGGYTNAFLATQFPSDIANGVYQFSFEIDSVEVWRSDNFVVDSLPTNSTLIECWNDSDIYGVEYEGLPLFHNILRLPMFEISREYEVSYDSYRESTTGKFRNKKTRRDISVKMEVYFLPEPLHDGLSALLSLDNIRLNNKSVTIKSGYDVERNQRREYNKASFEYYEDGNINC
jgi:hypothetical protein